MSIKNLDSKKWLVRVRARVNCQVTERKLIVTGQKIDAREKETALIKELDAIKKSAPVERSLKLCTFGEVLEFWATRTSAKTEVIQHLIDRLAVELGSVRNEEIQERFGDFMDALKTERAGEWIGTRLRQLNAIRHRAGKPAIVRKLGGVIKPSTRNRYRSIVQTAYAFVMNRGKLPDNIKDNPIKTYSKELETARDRVWTDDERKAIFEVLEKRKSALYWAAYFSSFNPIRRGDLLKLTRENFSYNQFNPAKSFIHFLPQKTGRHKPRNTQLICLDQKLLDYLKGLPADCPLLFPRLDSKGRWRQLKCFKREWYAVLNVAKVADLTWHDLKHCAITWMLDNGFSELDLKNLGIQYSADMIARYYHKDPSKARGAWDKIQVKAVSLVPSVVPDCGTSLQKSA